MNTLPEITTPEITTSAFFDDAADIARLHTHWSGLIQSEARYALRPEHFLLYQALRGKDWRKAFAPITNTKKLENGGFWAWGRLRALAAVHSSFNQEALLQPFGAIVTAEALARVRARLPRRVQDAEDCAYLEAIRLEAVDA